MCSGVEAVGCVNLGGAKVIVVVLDRIYHGWVMSCGSGGRRWRHDKEGRGGEWWWSHAVVGERKLGFCLEKEG